MKKIGIIGAGHVGATIAYLLATKNICEEIVLIDVNKSKAQAECDDINDSLVDNNDIIKVVNGDYTMLDDASIVVITAGGGPTDDDKVDRIDAFDESMRIVDDISANLCKTKFTGIIISIGNPADLVAHRILEKTGYESKKVISTGTYIDSLRLRGIISEKLSVKRSEVEGYMLGEHGESQFAVYSNVKVNGEPIKNKLNEEALNDIENTVKARGWNIFKGKGSTHYGVAQAAFKLIEEIFNTSGMKIPCSVCLRGEYGYNDVHISTLAEIDKDGVKNIFEVNLDDSEKIKMINSIKKLKKIYKSKKQ